MKKRMLLTGMILLLMATSSWGAGTVTGQTAITTVGNNVYKIVLSCTGDSGDGTIPDTTLVDFSKYGLYVYRVIIENLAADANVTADSDVYLKDADGTDLLGGQGVDQLDDSTRNYITLTDVEPSLGALVFSVANQATVSGVWTVTFILVR